MPPSPWVRLCAVRPDQDCLVLLSYLPLRRWRKLPAFFRYVQTIRGQLQETDGALGYSLLAHLFRLEFWTLSAWRDRTALNDFVRASPHLEIMSALRGDMGPTRFIEWHTTGAQLPPAWADTLERFKKESANA